MKIFTIGDSIMKTNNITKYPQTGWVQALPMFLVGSAFSELAKLNDNGAEIAAVCEIDPHFFDKQIVIENHAENGRSTKSFINEGRLDIVLSRLKPGDFVICNFGHNDEKLSDSSRGTEAFGEYQENLHHIAQEVKKRGGNIVFATSVARHKFEDGKAVNTHGDYPQAMLELCTKHNYTCVDLASLTQNALNNLGEQNSLEFYMVLPSGVYINYPNGQDDHSHLQYAGAVEVARLFVTALKLTNSKLKEYFL